jgi:hypothetical protein
MTTAISAIFQSSRGIVIVLCILLIIYTLRATITEIDYVNLALREQASKEISIPATRMYHNDMSVPSDHPNGKTNTLLLRNLRLVFLGDSLTRYQYLSLAYYLRYGYWYDTTITVNNLMSAHSFHHPSHPNEDWNEFFLQSNRILHPMEICDCIRGSGVRDTTTNSTTATTTEDDVDDDILVERRYFYDHRTNNMLVYINMNGNETSPGRGYYGRLQPETIFTSNFSNLVGIVSRIERFHRNNDVKDRDKLNKLGVVWEYPTWNDVIRKHVGNLDFSYNQPKPNSRTTDQQQPNAYVLLNAGLHPHDFHNVTTVQNVVDALRDTNLHGTWKTTTYTKVHVLHEQSLAIGNSLQDDAVTDKEIHENEKYNVSSTHISDTYMCLALANHCLNVSWILRLRPPVSRYYVDNLHFIEPLYRIMNEQYLQQLSLLTNSSHYLPYNQSNIVQELVH